MCYYNSAIKGKMNLYAFVLLIICGLANGITDFMQKVFVKQLPEISVSVFNFYVYVFSAAILGLFFLLSRWKERKAEKLLEISAIRNMIVYIMVMSVCLFVNSFFKTKAVMYLNSVQLYPLNQGLSLTLSMIMATVLFHEKVNRKCILGIAIAFMGLLIINVL